ncbi:MAG: response regulator [Chitinophagales bacterium]
MPGRVLVVEDNELHLQLVSDLLTLYGFEVLKASTGARALVLAEEGGPDLILMDISLQGTNGFEVTRMLKRNPNTAGIPVVALTAYAMQHDQEEARQAGCAGYIAKPINTRTFPSLVQSFIARGGPDGGRTRRKPANRRG